HLALAAYNWGEGNVQRAIARNTKAGLPTDYLSLNMPAETRHYVPKLFIIARLKALGLGPILAIEPNAARRAMAERMGADIVLSPGNNTGATWWNDLGLPIGMSDAMAVTTEQKNRSRAIVFECVGKPGMLMTLAKTAPTGATLVVVGNCMETDAIEPAFLLQKSLTLRFVFAYSPPEFGEAFAMIADNPDRLAPMVTGMVGLTELDTAFAALTGGDGSQVKLLISSS
ncbi:zinc-binding dehydrogenase, partial [Sphingobium sp.]|uniref:zinc-binding dehydrogenase n=1 Tax=Sphingobium sp. TaxID=1912891 RepID=UPI002C9B188D